MKVKDFISQQNFYYPVINCITSSQLENAIPKIHTGMKCDIIDIRQVNRHKLSRKVYIIAIDFSCHSIHNRTLLKPNEAIPSLEEFAIMEDEDIETYFSWNEEKKIDEKIMNIYMRIFYIYHNISIKEKKVLMILLMGNMKKFPV